jgi:uncharacterized protein YbjT (DUF2867 family)
LAVLFYFLVISRDKFVKKQNIMKHQSKPALILSANGKTGSRVAQKLEELQFPIRKGSRTAEKRFDWEDKSTWAGVLEGVASVYITFQPDLAVPGAEEAIESFVKLAVDAGVEKLVLLSGRGEPGAERCEQLVINSGLKWTIVRASWFNQNFSESYLLYPVRAGFVCLPAGEVKEPFVDADDIADVVVASLTEDGHDNKVYEVTGPRLLSFRDAIGEIASATNQPIQYIDIPLEEYQAQLKEYHVPDEVISLISYLFAEVLDGRNESVTSGVEQALGRKPKDFAVYVQENLATGVWTMQETATGSN